MIKRAFKLRNRLEFNKIDVNLMQRAIIDLGAFIVLDKDTLAVQIVTHISGRKEYLVLIPGATSFIIMNISERSKEVLLKALEKVSKWLKLNKKNMREIKALIDLYLFIDTFDKGIIKNEVKKLIEENIDHIKRLDPRILKNLLGSIAEAAVNVAIEDIASSVEFPQRSLQYFNLKELKEIFKHEIMVTEAKSYALRLLKNNLRELIES